MMLFSGWRRTSVAVLLVALIPAASAGTARASQMTHPGPLHEVRRLRHELGFSVDDALLAALQDRKFRGEPVHEDLIGIPLSDAEHAELLVRDELGRVDAVTTRRAFESRPDFGGVYLDISAGGSLHLLTTGDPGEVSRWLSPRLRRPDRLTVTRVHHTLAELLEAKAHLVANGESLGGRGAVVTGLGIDEPGNAVRVSLAHVSSDARAAVTELLPAGIKVTFVERARRRLAGGNVQNSLPFRGGQSIRNSSAGTAAPSFDCSLGFVGYQTASNGTRSPAVITGGHCGESGTAWYQYNQFMGISTTNTFPFGGGATYADAMRIPISQGASNDVLAANYAVFDISGWEGQYDGVVNQTVCNNGAVSYRVCGTLIDNNFTDYLDADNGKTVRLDYLRLTTSTLGLGDSGGAVTHTAGAHYASGIVATGAFEPGATLGIEMAYVHIYNALRALQLTGLYTS